MKARSRTISQGSWALLFAVAVWAVGWWCAPSVGVASLGTWIYQDDAVAAILLGAAVSLVILSVLLVTQPTLRRVVWRRHWTLVFLILPMLLFTTLPFRVGGVSASLAGVPVGIYADGCGACDSAAVADLRMAADTASALVAAFCDNCRDGYRFLCHPCRAATT